MTLERYINMFNNSRNRFGPVSDIDDGLYCANEVLPKLVEIIEQLAEDCGWDYANTLVGDISV